ncbi:MAG: thioredoxin domain-containing protein [Acidimicrobiales bacterium]
MPANRLAQETSPYLRQHADNPVDWYPWGDEAFAQARGHDIPVMLSIGYAACHWCHVMAHESFEDPAVAGDLAGRFVAVKVDREERPDVDALYMEAVQALTGHGGWPMTVFLTPDQRPFFAGTYFPPEDRHGMPGFRRVLDAVSEAWLHRRQEIEEQADELARSVVRRAAPVVTLEPGSDVAHEARFGALLDTAVQELATRFDPEWGGFGPAPKFPQAGLVELCLRRYRRRADERDLDMARTTLSAMASGGIYDHLGGGFCRYSTDRTWTVPHFEKMLYDQAGLVRVFLHAWQLTGEPDWLQVVRETIDYVERDLSAADGGWCSAQDADSEGEEGRFYLWERAEFDAVTGPDAEAARAYYGLDGAPNFEGRYILRRPLGAPLARPDEVERAAVALLEARQHRVRPARDDKVLTEWNAMFCSALAEAALATGDSRWTELVVRGATFLLERPRRPDGRWLRSWDGERGRHLAYAADYAWLVDGFTRTAEATGDPRWLDHGAEAATELLRLFSPGPGPLSMCGTDGEELLVNPVDLLDGATPSATAVAGQALIRLGALRGDDVIVDQGVALLESLRPVAARHPLATATAVAALELIDGGVTEIVVTGSRHDLVRVAATRYEPTAVLAWGEPGAPALWGDRPEGFAYVCRHRVCAAPAADADDLRQRLDEQVVPSEPTVLRP